MYNQTIYQDIFSGYPDVVSVEQLMEMLHIGKVLAYNLLQSGKIVSMKIGREYKIPKVRIIEFLLTKPEVK